MVISLETENDTQEVEDWLLKNCFSATRAKVQVGMSHFMGGAFKHDTDTGKPITFLLLHSLYFNHSDDANTRLVLRNGYVLLIAKRDIVAGEELHMDYRDMYYYPGVDAWLMKRKLKSTTRKVLT
eukprot:IDg7626t1